MIITQKESGKPVVEVWPHLQNELHHFGVDQTMNRLSVDVGDEVTSAQTGLLGRTAILNVLPNHQKQPRAKQVNASDKDFSLA